MAWGWEDYGDYVSADEKRQRADASVRKLEKGGRKLSPVRLTGRAIASSFWGKAWNQNLEGYGDYASRLPRGRSYLRQGAVLDLQIARGTIQATVSGTRLYEVAIKIDMLEKAPWGRLKQDCAGRVGTLMDLLQGKLSGPVMEIVTRQKGGLFPKPREIHLDCSCPDYADLCKHVAAVLYGVGARLDERPELLFTLRGVDHLELIAAATGSLQAELAAPAGDASAGTLDEGSLAEIFGIDLGMEVATPRAPKPAPRPVTKLGKKATPLTTASSARAAKPAKVVKTALPSRRPAPKKVVGKSAARKKATKAPATTRKARRKVR